MSAERANELLSQVAEAFRKVLGDNLTGVYAHGSLAFGCFRWAVSDIDFLAVVERPISQEEKVALIGVLLEREEDAPRKGFEMSVVLSASLKPFVYPTPFELHFSNTYLAECRTNAAAYCARPHGGDPDLAAHCMVTRAAGYGVMGAPVEEVFGEVPKESYLDSVWLDVEGAKEDILENPVYVILNLCRVLAVVCQNLVLSKKEGGEWAMKKLDGRAGLIRRALAAYAGGETLEIGPEEQEAAREFAEYMLTEIQKDR